MPTAGTHEDGPRTESGGASLRAIVTATVLGLVGLVGLVGPVADADEDGDDPTHPSRPEWASPAVAALGIQTPVVDDAAVDEPRDVLLPPRLVLHLDASGTLIVRRLDDPDAWVRRDLAADDDPERLAAALHRDVQAVARRHAGDPDDGSVPAVLHVDERTPWRHVARLLRILDLVHRTRAEDGDGSVAVRFAEVVFAVRRRDADGGLGYGQVVAPLPPSLKPPHFDDAAWDAHTARWLRLRVQGVDAEALAASGGTRWRVGSDPAAPFLPLGIGRPEAAAPRLAYDRAIQRIVLAVRAQVRRHREARGRYPTIVLVREAPDAGVRCGDVVRVLHGLEAALLPPPRLP